MWRHPWRFFLFSETIFLGLRINKVVSILARKASRGVDFDPGSSNSWSLSLQSRASARSLSRREMSKTRRLLQFILLVPSPSPICGASKTRRKIVTRQCSTTQCIGSIQSIQKRRTIYTLLYSIHNSPESLPLLSPPSFSCRFELISFSLLYLLLSRFKPHSHSS